MRSYPRKHRCIVKNLAISQLKRVRGKAWVNVSKKIYKWAFVGEMASRASNLQLKIEALFKISGMENVIGVQN